MTDETEPRLPTRRERSRQATRVRIYVAAISLFTDRGYEPTSMDDIAARADVARTTVFNHFEHKDRFVATWVAERRDVLTRLHQRPGFSAMGVRDQLRTSWLALGELHEANPEESRVLLQAWVRTGGPFARHTSAEHPFTRTIRIGQQHREVPPSVDPERAGLLVSDAYLGTALRWAAAPRDAAAPLRASLLDALDLVLSGLLVPG